MSSYVRYVRRDFRSDDCTMMHNETTSVDQTHHINIHLTTQLTQKAMRSMLVIDRSARTNQKPLKPACTMTRRLTALTIAAAAVLSADAFVPSPSTSAGRAAFATSLEAKAGGLGEDTLMSNVGKAIATAALALAVFDPSPAFADGQTEKFKLPPIDKNDKMRCQFNDSKMGQANAQRDKVSSPVGGRCYQ